MGPAERLPPHSWGAHGASSWDDQAVGTLTGRSPAALSIEDKDKDMAPSVGRAAALPSPQAAHTSLFREQAGQGPSTLESPSAEAGALLFIPPRGDASKLPGVWICLWEGGVGVTGGQAGGAPPASHSLSPLTPPPPQDKDSPNHAVGAQGEAIFGDELSGVLLGDTSAMGRRPERNGSFFSSAYVFPK